ncbi:MAG: iron(III) transport system ATP-binding protein [Alphaproteobacteria bacterium]|jgi:iron(III) transport system ATP-binding protein|nr:iron(III) transport system ATP-binding protein [Alphaproteobacteria bacterium]
MLRVERLSKIFDNATDQIAGGIREASFALEPGTFFTLLGPSGCGKTTTLRCIAGLETPDDGVITVDDRVLFNAKARINVPVEQRSVGMVFQSYAIWPHMTVAENVAFPFTVSKQRRYSKAEIEEGVKRALHIVDLDGFQQRPATRLSGGQQQRVALARAIVHEPRLLLLDEPLSNLDAQLRDDMRGELKRLQSKIGITTVYVTHDQSEALALSDQIAVIDRGRITQIGSPQDIYFRPANPFVARFVGATNLLSGRLIGSANGKGQVEVLSGRRIDCLVPQPIADTSAVSVSIRPESIQLVHPDGRPAVAPGNCLAGRIAGVTFLGAARRVDVLSDGVNLQVTTSAELPLPGDGEVLLLFAAERAVALPGKVS